MVSVSGENFLKAKKAREIIDLVNRTYGDSMLVALFGGVMSYMILPNLLPINGFEILILFLVFTCAVGALWWDEHDFPKRKEAAIHLKQLLPYIAVSPVNYRKVFSAAEIYISKEKRRAVFLIKEKLLDFDTKEHRGGGFDICYDTVCPTSRIVQIRDAIISASKEHSLFLNPVFMKQGIWGNGSIYVCVNILGESVYFG